MKYLPITLFLLLCCGIFVINTKDNQYSSNYDYFRIHIRANSNYEIDQNIKYIVKDEVVNFVTPYLVDCDTKSKSIEVLSAMLNTIENVCDKVLKENNFNYTSRVRISQEYFPTRSYDNVTLEAGVYDSLMIELGSGEGDNWWCIVYPPLCFVNNNCTDAQNIKYQSYLLEIIKKYFD